MKNSIVFLIILFSSQLFAQAQVAKIRQQTGDKQLYIFSGQQNFRSLKLFSNAKNADKTIEETISSPKPSHIYAKHIVMDQQGKAKNLFLSLMVLPGDTVILDNNKNIISSNGFKASIDSVLNLSEDDYSPTKNYINEITELGLKQFVKKIQARFLFRDQKTNKLKAPLTKEHFKALHNFNYLVKAKNISQIPFYAIKLKNEELSLLDSCYQNIKENTHFLKSIESSFSLSIYSFLLRYDAYKKNLPVNVFWDYAFKVDQSIQNSTYYLPYLFLLFENGYNDPQLPKKLIPKIDSLKIMTRSLDTFLNVLSILDRSLINFDKSKAELANIADGKYLFFMKSEKNKQRNINEIGPIQITNMADEKMDFKKILFDNDSKITVIDFWASWCIPCIEEYPEFKEAKKKLPKVRFINLSIDKDEASDKWKAKVNELNGTNTNEQYRLADLDSKGLYNYFKIGSIPRYVVIDKTGKILAFDFFRPKEINFQKVLALMLNDLY